MSAPERVRTTDGMVWERRAETRGGLALYAVEGAPRCCPPFVMATLAELAEHGVQSAEVAAAVAVLGPEPGSARERVDTAFGVEARLFKSALDKVFTILKEGHFLRSTAAAADTGALIMSLWARVAESEHTVQQMVDGLNGHDCPPPGETPMQAVTRFAVRLMEAERHSTNEALDDAVQALRADRDSYPPALPWAKLMDAEDLADFLDELAASAITHASNAKALSEVEATCGRWRLIAEAQHGHNTAPGPAAVADGIARRIVPVQALREDEAAPKCRCDEPGADPYACEADDCTHEFSELNPFGGAPVEGHDAKVSRTCGCGFRTTVWHVADGSAEAELHDHVTRVHGGVYPGSAGVEAGGR